MKFYFLMNNKKFFAIAIVVVLVLIIGVFALQLIYKKAQPNMYEGTDALNESDVLKMLPEVASLEPENVNNIIVEANQFTFSPSQITVFSGETVRITLRNLGTVRHNLELECPGLEIKTRFLEPGEEDSIEFTANWESGTRCDYYCTVPGYREQGMEGSLIIQ